MKPVIKKYILVKFTDVYIFEFFEIQLGHKAEYYKQNQEELSHKKLLRSFGAQESLADEMLNDKGIFF